MSEVLGIPYYDATTVLVEYIIVMIVKLTMPTVVEVTRKSKTT